MQTPPAVPSGVISLLPQQMWAAYWKYFPDGTQELPATIPQKIWATHCNAVGKPEEAHSPPRIWIGYWDSIDKNEYARIIHKIPLSFWEEYISHL